MGTCAGICSGCNCNEKEVVKIDPKTVQLAVEENSRSQNAFASQVHANQYYEEHVDLVVKCQTAIRGKIARTQLYNARNYTRDVE